MLSDPDSRRRLRPDRDCRAGRRSTTCTRARRPAAAPCGRTRARTSGVGARPSITPKLARGTIRGRDVSTRSPPARVCGRHRRGAGRPPRAPLRRLRRLRPRSRGREAETAGGLIRFRECARCRERFASSIAPARTCTGEGRVGGGARIARDDSCLDRRTATRYASPGGPRGRTRRPARGPRRHAAASREAPDSPLLRQVPGRGRGRVRRIVLVVTLASALAACAGRDRGAGLALRYPQFVTPPKAHLLTPGPTPVPPEVAAAMDEPMVYHRGPEFSRVLARVFARLPEVFRTGRRGDPVHRVRAAGRWTRPSRTCARPATGCSSSRPATSASAGRRSRDATGWTSSTSATAGARHRTRTTLRRSSRRSAARRRLLHPLRDVDRRRRRRARIGRAGPRRGSADGGRRDLELSAPLPLEQQAWGIDVVVSGSQKALMTPPGLAFASVSPAAVAAVGEGAPRRASTSTGVARSTAQADGTNAVHLRRLARPRPRRGDRPPARRTGSRRRGSAHAGSGGPAGKASRRWGSSSSRPTRIDRPSSRPFGCRTASTAPRSSGRMRDELGRHGRRRPGRAERPDRPDRPHRRHRRSTTSPPRSAALERALADAGVAVEPGAAAARAREAFDAGVSV